MSPFSASVPKDIPAKAFPDNNSAYHSEAQETIVNFNVEEKMATVYTREPATIGQIDALVIKYPDTFRCIGETKQISIKPMKFRNLQLLTGSLEESVMLRENKSESRCVGLMLKARKNVDPY